MSHNTILILVSFNYTLFNNISTCIILFYCIFFIIYKILIGEAIVKPCDQNRTTTLGEKLN